MQDEIDEVLRLVTQPLRLRNKLLDGECKFVLNSSLLFKINKVLDIFITEPVDIILSDVKRRQLQLLLNVLNSIPKLTVTQRSAESFENVINLSKFKRLKHLELVRVCLHLVVGLDSLKTQLETFFCNRCTKYNGIICKQKELEWPELKYFNLRYMKLDCTTSGFFMNKPWIQVLDLSYNRLTNINGLDYLDHLVVLIVSFNHLESIPKFSKDSEKRLEMLVLNNNHLPSLAGLEKLSGLKQLDVNYNIILDKSEYNYLSHLKELRSLNFSNNPVSAIKYSNLYLVSSLSNDINIQVFLLNKELLSSYECRLVGRKVGPCQYSSGVSQQNSKSDEIPPEERSKYRRPGKRISKPREVVIEDVPSGSNSTEILLPESIPKEEAIPTSVFSTTVEHETVSKENELMEQLLDFGKKTEEEVHQEEETPHDKLKEIENNDAEVNLDSNASQGSSNVEPTTLLISATVHASDCSSNENIIIHDNTNEGQFIGNTETDDDIHLLETSNSNLNESYESSHDEELSIAKTQQKGDSENKHNTIKPLDFLNFPSKISQTESTLSNLDSNENVTKNILENDQDRGISLTGESDEAYSDIEDEVFWQVQSVDKETGRTRNVILVLLDDEIKERSTESGRTITRWQLQKIVSCTKTKVDPFTIELEFDTLRKDKQFRIYIMEYPDAQVLLKKVYSILECKPLSSMNQRTYECIKCGSFFVRSLPIVFKARDTQINCSVCSSTLVIEVEEPKLPEPQNTSDPAISHSSSHSSIGKSNIETGEAACMEWKPQCSAASLDPSSAQDRRLSTQRYESDIEVISNPSQSSIEVLGEHSRSVTPRRKISNEEKSGSVQFPTQLTTVMEINSPFTNLTESSSSGSLTESVITAYEAINNNKKAIIYEGILAEEENSPTSEQDPLSDGFEEEKPASAWRKESDIYSFTDFTDVDPRIKLFLYQSLFQDDNEALLLLVKCHLWRTGGSDFDGCAVFSTSKVYFLSHSRTNFREDLCDWLTLFDSFSIKEIKEISPLMWQQGARVQIKHLSYLILLMDQERTTNLFKHMRGFLTDVKLQNNINSSFELSLQQAVLSSSSVEKSIDPSVVSYTICLSITVLKDEVENEILRLGSLVLTSGEFHVIPGDLTWHTASIVPSVITSQDISNLIEVEKGKNFVVLHFLDEKEAIEEVWRLKLVSDVQVSFIVDSIRIPWEQMFCESLEVTVRS